MAKPQERLGFVGIGAPSPGMNPEAWMNSLVETDLHQHQGSLQDVVRHLQQQYDIERRPVYWVPGEDGPRTQVQLPGHEVDEDAEKTGYHALVNPAWEQDMDACPQDTPVWHIATADYTPVSPMDKYGPLLAAMRENGQETKEAFGEVRRYRNGGEIHADIWFPGIQTELAGQNHVIGMTSGYDYYGGTALYATIIAANTETGTIMRGITDKRRRRHRGAAGDAVAEWWQKMLAQAEQATDALAQVVAEAQGYTVDFTEMPITSEQYLLALFDGTQDYAERADERLAGGHTPDQCTAWALYDAMATTLTQDFDGKDGSAALRKYLRGANEQLFSPPSAERTAAEWLENWDGLEGQQDLNGDEIQAKLREHRLGLADAVQRVESRKETLKRMLNEIDNGQEANQ